MFITRQKRNGHEDSGKETTRLYDNIGRLEKETIVNTGAYTRYEYPTNNIQSKVYSTIIDATGNGADATDEVYSESWTDGAGRVRKSRTEHPNSTGGWTGSLVEYDTLGQVKRSTVPTEINSSYVPTGDDNRGLDANNNPIWLWSQQEYDWKGRVVRSIPTDSTGSDGKDQLISYEGCGCAGGQVTTIYGEVVPKDTDPNETARRTQKIYEDILGRTFKTEVLNWDGSTIYTTTVQTFNGRDQVVKTRQYAGNTSSSTYQDVTMTYDGHGRMKTRHYPIEDANTETSWIYNADDSIQQVLDPRGAISNFTYNERGLVSDITYTPPANHPEIPDSPNVSFTYDAVGNRTEMDTDGVNKVTYNYNDLSRLTSETVDFDSLTNNLTVSYAYHLGGGLKSVTDPFGYDVNYTNDKIGRLTSVTGDPVGSNPTGNYADNIKYRAFGQLKQMDYRLPDDTSQIRLEFDNRLRVSHAETTKANNFVLKADYNYFADSRVQSKDDLLDNKWDRTMKYDFAGRLSFNQFGMGLNSNNGNVRVYEQTLQYDAFSMLTQRNGLYWGEGMGFTNSYQNGRIQNFPGTYDAAGNILASAESENRSQVTTIDAASRRAAMTELWEIGGGPQEVHYVFENKTEYIFDGDGRPVKEGRGGRQVNVENPPPLTISEYSYQVWSTVLGKSLTKVKNDGTKDTTEIYAGGAAIAKQNADGAQWRTADPVTGTTAVFYMYNGASYAGVEEESEPLGQKISKTAPVDDAPINYSAYLGTARDPEWQCQIPESFYGGFEGMPWHCQRPILEDLDNSLQDIYGWQEEEESPVNVSILIKNYQTLPNPQGESKMALAANKIRIRTLTATTKIPDIGEFKVDVFDDSIPGFVDASESGEDDEIMKLPRDLWDRKRKIKDLKGFQEDFESRLAITKGDEKCVDKLDELLKEMGAKSKSIKGLADTFFKGKNKLYETSEFVQDIRVKNTKTGKWEKSSNSVVGLTSWSGANFEMIIEAHNPNVPKVETFIHELLHAATRGSTHSHEEINNAVRKILNTTDPFWNLDRYIRKFCSMEEIKR